MINVDRDVIPSPNIWHHPDVYEVENHGVDPDGAIETAMRGIHDWTGQTILDIGCGTGYHLPRFAAAADRVVGVEPHPPLVALARERIRRLDAAVRDRVDVRQGTAQALPLPDSSADVVHARWAYFFGPGCEPGLRELARVVRRGGTAFVIDNDGTRSTFGRWFLRALPTHDTTTPAKWSGSGPGRAGTEFRWTSAGTFPTGPRSRPSCASSSPPRSPTPCWPSTTARRSTTPSTSTGASSDHTAAKPSRRAASRCWPSRVAKAVGSPDSDTPGRR